MKFIVSILAVISAVTCENKTEANIQQQEVPATPVEQTVVEPDTLVGAIDPQDLREAPFSSWFEAGYESYSPSPEILATIDEHIHDYDIKLYMGTWCSDSQRDVPKFLKLLELTDYDRDRLELIAVEGDKTLPNDAQKVDDIEYVPTIIFLKDGKEVNRFVEYPQVSLEKDIADIVSGAPYENSYANW